MASAPPPLRRITRSSLARFAYTAGNDDDTSPAKETMAMPDIEDIIPSSSSIAAADRKATTTASRKRKRTVLAPSKATPTVKTESPQVDPAAATPRRRARKALDAAAGLDTVTPPRNWEAVYATAKAMRQPGGAAANAAVDTMGCERLADAAASARDQRFQTLVALMLSSQTKDTTTAAAMRRLQTELPGGLNVEAVLAAAPATLNALIRTVGFHNAKTAYLQRTAAVLRDRWAGDIPDTIAGLTALPGVGPKMAHLCLSSAWGRTEGIGVDVHVHRITNRWGWHRTATPEATRRALEAWLPRERWREINALLVGLGQTVCAPVRPRCGDCALGLAGLCRAADAAKVRAGWARRAAAVKEEDGGGGGGGGKIVKTEEEAVSLEETAAYPVVLDEKGPDSLPAAADT